MKYFILILCVLTTIFSEQARAQDLEKEVNNYLQTLTTNNKLLFEDFEFKITSEHVSNVSGVHHVYFSQYIDDIQIYGTESALHLHHEPKRIIGNNRFVKNCTSILSAKSHPLITPLQAIVHSANELNYEISKPLIRVTKKKTSINEYIFSNGGFSVEEIPVTLKYMLNSKDELILVWDVSILELNYQHWWSILVDASSGNILLKRDNVNHCNFESVSNSREVPDVNLKLFDKAQNSEKNGKITNCTECYEVIKIPLDSPYRGDRSMVINPAHPVASPYGWHDTDGISGAEHNTTNGNNLNAFSGNPQHYLYEPDGGEMLSFIDYPFETIYTEEEPYKDASVVNVFYWGNIIHDVLYQYGFDESSGNFQKNNYDRGGIGDDQMKLLGQSVDRVCNASFGSGPDGTYGFLSVNICNEKDGDFDNTVVIHEYVHGLSNRLVGGGNSPTCLHNAEQMGEGWSDYYALMLTMDEQDLGEESRGIAAYLRGQGPSGNGIRPYPYSTNMTTNPLTYDSIKTFQRSHGVGMVWATMLWEVTWGLIDQYGIDPDIYNFQGNIDEDSGNIIALAIITESLKYIDCLPGLIDARDAIFEADLAIYGGKNHCIIWDAFAKRGLGIGASQGSSLLVDDGLESFETTSSETNLTIEMDNICLNQGVIYGLTGGYPYGGVYNGPGVTDEGNGYSYTFDTTLAGIGNHTITYETGDSNCSITSSSSHAVRVFFNDHLEQVVCPEDIEVTLEADQNGYSLIEFYPTNGDNIDCSILAEYTQDPISGTRIGTGNTTVTLYATTLSGQTSTCTFNIKVEATGVEGENVFTLFPNPTSDELILASTKDIKTLDLVVFDYSGRVIDEIGFSNFGFNRVIPLSNLSTGVYFIFLRFEGGNDERFRIIKK